MTNDTASDTATSNKLSERIQTLAWMIVAISFVLFCSLSLATSGGIYYFFFRSTVPMNVVLQVGRGTVPVMTIDSEQVVRSNSSPTNLEIRDSTVNTDAQSQTTISFQLPDDEEILVLATITLQNNSNITFTSAHRPRFDWSDGFYSINMMDFIGEADILVTEPPDNRPFNLQIHTSLGGATFLIDEPGRYSISANETIIQLTSFEGQAILLSPSSEHNRLVRRGEQVILRTGGNVPIVSAAPVNLLENGLFTFEMLESSEEIELIPQRWACFRHADAPPSGNWSTDTWQGRPALRLVRNENATTNGQTGCFQVVDTDVTEYSLLELKATFLLNYQSLPNCGVLGSECPMMIFVDYTDINGNHHTWSQGIFSNFDAQSTYPLICQSCGTINEHRQISEKVWYTYESGNLFNRLPPEERPASIEQIRFYASGHRYDVFVSEMALFAGTPVTPPINELEHGD